MSLIERTLNRLFVRHDIGRPGDGPYLTRWEIWGKRFGSGQKLFLHLFHRGDAEIYNHDHPWSFWSLILWGGYWEITDAGKRWYGPLRLLRRPAAWRHRVELPSGRRCWTLIWCGERERSWYFHCPQGAVHWKQHAANTDAGMSGCGED